MIYILEMGGFLEEDKLKSICRKIEASGYISTSTERELKKITGVDGIVYNIQQKVENIESFFEKWDIDYFDDILLEVFDGSQYTYEPFFGLNADTYLSSNLHATSELFQNYDQEFDKNAYLLSNIFKFINKMTSGSHRKAVADREELKSKRRWIQDVRSRGASRYDNFYEKLFKIRPMVRVQIRHKDYQRYYGGGGFTISDGWGYRQYSSTEDSATSKIEKIMLRRGIGDCIVTTVDGSFTPSRYYNNNNELHTNPNPLLVTGNLDISFLLK